MRDFFTTGILLGNTDEEDDVKEITDVFNTREKWKAYKKYERKIMKNYQNAIIPFIAAFLTGFSYKLEVGQLTKLDEIRMLNDNYQRLQEYQRRARLYTE